MKEDLQKIRLPLIRNRKNKKFIIYGTGIVGCETLKKIKSQYGENQVSFFLNSSPDEENFWGIPVLKPEELTEQAKNSHIFILATFSNERSMKKALLLQNVKEEDIVSYPRYYSFDKLAESQSIIKRVCIYPEIKDRNKLEELVDVISCYGTPNKNQKLIIDFYTELQIENSNSFFKFIKGNIIDLSSYDLIFVWNNDNIYDEILEQNNMVFCIDKSFYENIDINMSLLLSYKTIPEKMRTDFQINSRNNFIKLKKMVSEKNKALIVGNGPSLSKGIANNEEFINPETFACVCNSIINDDAIVEKIVPSIYVLYDSLHLRGYMKQTLDKIIKYVKVSDCFLIVPEKWLPFLVAYYQDIDEKLIGMKNDVEKGYHFPSEDDLSLYTKPDNVVTRYMIPIASSMADEIYFIGCDGAKNMRVNEFEHSKNMDNGFKVNYQMKERPTIDLLNKYTKCLEQHAICFEEIINYGILQNKIYKSISDSHIPILHKLYWKNEL